MFHKLRTNTRLHFLLIAISLAVISGFMGLAAYLTDVTDPLSATFKVRYGRDFGIGISSDSYSENADIIPGETAAFDPKLTNSGNYDAYVFMEVTLPDQTFSLSEISSDWHPLTSVTDKTVYYYGTSSDLTALAAIEKAEDGSMTPSQTSPLCSGITLDKY